MIIHAGFNQPYQPTLLGQRHFSRRILHLGLSYDALLMPDLWPEGRVSTPKNIDLIVKK